MRRIWNDGWTFWVDRQGGDNLAPNPAWIPVTLPHDWQIWHVKNLYEDGTGWYRKTFNGSPPPGHRWALYFEGVYMDTTVFVNGVPVWEWKNGYSSFQVDITDFLHANHTDPANQNNQNNQNELLVRCRLRHPNARWYSGAGIYRDVWLFEYPDSHLIADSLYIAPREAALGRWEVFAQAEIENAAVDDRLEFTLLDDSGTPVTTSWAAPDTGAVTFSVENPRLWDVDEPVCYTMWARLWRGDEILDEQTSACGFRTIEMDPNRGLFLNHRHIFLHGVGLHHDLGCLGAAFSYPAAERQIRLMKEMGVNAIRTAHNMPAPGIMDLANRYGLLVANEAFDCWQQGKNPYDYARFFSDWYQRDVAAWVRRDRNHPSLLFWSIGNEVYDTHLDPHGWETTKALVAEVRRHDPRRNGAVTFGSNYMAWEGTQRCANALDAVGYNYGETLYDPQHREHPTWAIYGSETASIVQSRGIYHFPLSQPLLVDDDRQCSSLGNSRTSWGAKCAEACLGADAAYPYALGQFIWSGIDYIGEPTPYHTKSCYFGQADTACFPKDSFYRYQAGWHTWKEKPVLHLLPYWDFNPGQTIDVCVISNFPAVELLVNGVTQGRKTLRGGADICAVWQVTYVPGTVEAAAYDETGQLLARTEERSFGDAAALRVETEIVGGTMAFCTIAAHDRAGRPVKNANNYISVKTTGDLRLVGLDNGDSADFDEYKSAVRQLFSGKLLAVVTGCGSEGTGTLEAVSPGLESACCRLTLQPEPEPSPSIPAPPPTEGRIPVRKIEISASCTVLTPDTPTAVVSAKIYPGNADGGPLEWRAADDRGLDASYVKLDPVDATSVRVTGLGDGPVRVRCACHNGRDYLPILSMLELRVVGMGTLYWNPYRYLSAAIYTQSHAEIGNGNERGIATSRTEMSWVAYEGIDFGQAGADRLTVDVFEMQGIPTPIRFWKGIPYADGSIMIGERIYDKPTRWNTYQAETFSLDEPLTGRDVFGIELQCKVHIKGFIFQPRSRAWDAIPALTHDMLYGDSYRLGTHSVDGIGNNVSLVFRNLDFGAKGFTRLIVRGRTDLENNTIHILFEHDGETQRRAVEFARQPEMGGQTFALDPVYGMQDVTFLFLPGSNFDFMEFQFQ